MEVDQFQQIQQEIELLEAKTHTIHPHLRACKNLLNVSWHDLLHGVPATSMLDDVQSRMDTVLNVIDADYELRNGWVSDVLDQMVKVLAFHAFREKGQLMRASDARLARVTDEEYLGAIMSLTGELSRYSILRATAGDVEVVLRIRDLLVDLNGKLLEFDFRNGSLRRRYDSVKWALQKSENLIYELSIVDVVKPDDVKETRSCLLPENLEELETIRLKMVHFDDRREYVIKIARDIQKKSKSAIYAVHRGDMASANTLLESARVIIASLEPEVAALPGLRMSGSFPEAIEEWLEAELYRAWRLDGRLLTKAEAMKLAGSADFTITTTEYLGACIDFSGECGRYAVKQATARDYESVDRVLYLVASLSGEMAKFSCPGKIGKKESDLRGNLKKLELLRYEMELTKRGKGKVAAEVGGSSDQPPTPQGKDGKEEDT